MNKLQTTIDNNANKPLVPTGNLDLDNSNVSHTSVSSEPDTSYKNNKDSKDDNEVWTRGKLKDELYKRLVSVKIDGKRKYEEQAKHLFYRIPVYNPTPEFVINQSDLSPRLIEELESLDDKQLDEVIKEVLEWIYESISKEYFLLSIHRNNLIRWRIEQ